MKLPRIGWVGKDRKPAIISTGFYLQLEDVCVEKGTKEYWDACEYPPKKVRVIIEDVKCSSQRPRKGERII